MEMATTCFHHTNYAYLRKPHLNLSLRYDGTIDVGIQQISHWILNTIWTLSGLFIHLPQIGDYITQASDIISINHLIILHDFCCLNIFLGVAANKKSNFIYLFILFYSIKFCELENVIIEFLAITFSPKIYKMLLLCGNNPNCIWKSYSKVLPNSLWNHIETIGTTLKTLKYLI